MTVTQPETEDLGLLDDCIAEMVALANRINEIKRKQDMRDASEQLFDAVVGWEVCAVPVINEGECEIEHETQSLPNMPLHTAGHPANTSRAVGTSRVSLSCFFEKGSQNWIVFTFSGICTEPLSSLQGSLCYGGQNQAKLSIRSVFIPRGIVKSLCNLCQSQVPATHLRGILY